MGRIQSAIVIPIWWIITMTITITNAQLQPISSTAIQPGQSCTFANLDFNDLTYIDYPAYKVDGLTYRLHICGALTGTKQCTNIDPQAEACRVNSTVPADSVILGSGADGATWSWIDRLDASKGAQYILTGAAACGDSGANFESIVLLTCDNTTEIGVIGMGQNGCKCYFNVPTRHACGGIIPPPPPPPPMQYTYGPTVVDSSFPSLCVSAGLSILLLIIYHHWGRRAGLPEMTTAEKQEWNSGGDGSVAAEEMDEESPVPASVQGKQHAGGNGSVEGIYDSPSSSPSPSPPPVKPRVAKQPSSKPSSPVMVRVAKYSPVCAESNSLRSKLKFKLARRFFTLLILRAMLVNLTATQIISLFVALIDSVETCVEVSLHESYCQSVYSVDVLSLLFSMCFVVSGTLFVVLCPTLGHSCRCSPSKMFSLITAYAAFTSLMDTSGLQNLVFSLGRKLMQEIQDCTILHQLPADNVRTRLDWHMYASLALGALRIFQALWKFTMLQRLAFMPLLESYVSPRALARLLYDHFNARGVPYGLLPTHWCCAPLGILYLSGGTGPIGVGEGGASENTSLMAPMLPNGATSDSSASIPRSSTPASERARVNGANDVNDSSNHVHLQRYETPLLTSYDVSLPPKESPLVPHFNWHKTARMLCCQCGQTGWIALQMTQYIILLIQTIVIVKQFSKENREGTRTREGANTHGWSLNAFLSFVFHFQANMIIF